MKIPKLAGEVLLRSLAARLILFVFAATLLTSLVVAWVSAHSMDTFLREKIDQEFPALLTRTAERLDIWRSQRRLDVSTFSRSAVLVGNVASLSGGDGEPARAPREVGKYLSQVLEQSPQYRAIFILDREGSALSAAGTPEELPESLRKELAQVTSARLGDVRWAAGERYQFASAPIKDERNALRGSLHVLVRRAALVGLLQSERLRGGGSVFLVAGNGRLLTPAAGRFEAGHYDRPLPASEDRPAVKEYENAGVRVVGSALRLPHLGWTLVVEEPYSAVFQPSAAAVRKVLLINVATVVACCLIALRIALSIVRPVKALSLGARRIADGETNVSIPETSSRDELELLTRTFNRMSARLHRNRVELQENRLKIEAANVRLRGQNEELQRMNEALEQLSITDGLTKLYNHRFFQENLTREISRSTRAGDALTLILFDIDNFKQLNDRFGHASGDQVLCEVAAIMSSIVRESDVLARYGGEEFALMPGHSTLEGALGLAEKIRMSIAEHDMMLEENGVLTTVRVTVSAGVASYRSDRRAFFNDADRALYSAKGAGKDCVVVEDGADQASPGEGEGET